MPSRPSSSDGRGSLIVIEGMPGAGKTSAIDVLEGRRHQIVGEYVSERPGVQDDDAHQQNWIAKAEMAELAARSGDVYCDRDFVTSLAFAFSIEDRHLLRERVGWALAHLANGRLVVGDAYLVLDVAPETSLNRRAGRLSRDHPWSRHPELARLRRFYSAPQEALVRMHRDLAAAVSPARWRSASGEAMTPQQVADIAEHLAHEVSRCRP